MTTQHAERLVPADTLAVRLVIARTYAGYHNAAAAALATGVSRQTWANWERGRPMSHPEALIPHIAERLGVDEEWLRHGGPLRVDGPGGGGGVSAVQPTGQYAVDAGRSPQLALVAA